MAVLSLRDINPVMINCNVIRYMQLMALFPSITIQYSTKYKPCHLTIVT